MGTVSFPPVRSSSIYTNWHQWDVFLKPLLRDNHHHGHQCPLSTLLIFLETLVQSTFSSAEDPKSTTILLMYFYYKECPWRLLPSTFILTKVMEGKHIQILFVVFK